MGRAINAMKTIAIANKGAVMPSDSKVTLPDVYNVVRLLLRLGSHRPDAGDIQFSVKL
jgi:ABC-type hemin transport system ATPase subunit